MATISGAYLWDGESIIIGASGDCPCAVDIGFSNEGEFEIMSRGDLEFVLLASSSVHPSVISMVVCNIVSATCDVACSESDVRARFSNIGCRRLVFAETDNWHRIQAIIQEVEEDPLVFGVRFSS